MIFLLIILIALSVFSAYTFLNKGHYLYLGMCVSNLVLLLMIFYGYAYIDQLNYSVLNRLGNINLIYLDGVSYYFIYPVLLIFCISIVISKKKVVGIDFSVIQIRIPYAFELGIISLLISLLSYSFSDTVLDYPYPTQKAGVLLPNFLININAFLAYLALYSTFHKSRFAIKLSMVVVFILSTTFGTLLTSGSRGVLFTLTFLLCLQQILYLRRKFTLSNLLILIMLSLYGVVLFSLWPYMRGDIYRLDVIDSFLIAVDRSFYRVDGISFFDSIPMFPQSVFQFLYVIYLNLNDAGRESSELINFVYQQLPSFLEGAFYDRPLNDAYALMDSFFHGGGFFYLANLAWYGDYLSYIFSVTVLIYIVYLFERKFPMNNAAEVLCYYFSFLIFVVGLFYGIQPLLRSFQFGLVLLLLIRISGMLLRR